MRERLFEEKWVAGRGEEASGGGERQWSGRTIYI